MKETEQRVTAWAPLVFAVLAAIVTGLATLVRVLAATLPVPLWVLLVAMLLGTSSILWLVRRDRLEIARLTSELKVQANEHYQTQRIALANLENVDTAFKTLGDVISRADEVVFEDGAYFRKTDTERQQPFCRVCYDNRKALITVSETSDYDGQEWLPCYACPECDKSHVRQIVAPKPAALPEDDI